MEVPLEDLSLLTLYKDNKLPGAVVTSGKKACKFLRASLYIFHVSYFLQCTYVIFYKLKVLSPSLDDPQNISNKVMISKKCWGYLRNNYIANSF